MGEAVATVKLTLKDHGFRSSFESLKGRVKRGAGEMGQELSRSIGQGLKGGLDAVRGMASRLKEVGGIAVGLVGGIGIAGLVKGAIDTKKQFRELGFTLANLGAGDQLGRVRGELEALANQTGQSTGEVTAAFEHLLSKTGDLDFTSKTMKAIAATATATGANMETLADIMDGVNSAFGITGEQAPDVMAQMASLFKRSGVSAEEFAAKFEIVGQTAEKAGLKGREGLTQTAALLVKADASLGGMRKSIPAVTGLLDQLSTKAGRAEVFGKLGIGGAAGTDAMGAIRKIMAATQGRKDVIEKAFGGAQANLLVGLGKDFAGAFERTKGDVNTKTKAGLEAFDAALAQAGKSQLSAADIQQKAAEAMDDPDKKIQVTLNRLGQAFAKPQMMAAIDRLASSLPTLADAAARALDFIASNPLASGALLTTGVFAKGAAGGILGALMKPAGGMGKGGGGGDCCDGAAFGTAAAGELAKGAGPLGRGIAAAFGAAPAIALAGASVAAAIEQGVALYHETGGFKDFGARGNLDKNSEDIMDNARRQGRSEEAVWRPTWGGFGEGETKYLRRSRNAETGRMETKEYDTSELRQGSSFGGKMQQLMYELEQKAKGGRVDLAPVTVTAPKQADQARAAAREMASQITQSELRVRIMNPEDIRSSTGTVPGNLPRP